MTTTPETAPDRGFPVLIVDDVMSARRILKRLLVKLGYSNVLEAESGAGALTLADKNPRLIISDLHLNDMTGVDLFEKLCNSGKAGAFGFIVITSDATKEEFDDARAAGVSAYLLKPFDSAKLQEKINDAMAAPAKT